MNSFFQQPSFSCKSEPCPDCAEKDAEIIRLKDEIIQLKAKEIPLKEPFKIIHDCSEWKKG